MEMESVTLDEYIQEKNILLTTAFLLSIDSHAISGKDRFRSYRLFNNLQQAWDKYYSCCQKNYFTLYSENSRKILADKSLIQLQHSISKLIPLLKKEALDYLRTYIQNPEIGLPTYEVWA
jgi:hypothetical protein